MKASHDPSADLRAELRADEADVDDDLYQLNDIGLALRLIALRDAEIRTVR